MTKYMPSHNHFFSCKEGRLLNENVTFLQCGFCAGPFASNEILSSDCLPASLISVTIFISLSFLPFYLFLKTAVCLRQAKLIVWYQETNSHSECSPFLSSVINTVMRGCCVKLLSHGYQVLFVSQWVESSRVVRLFYVHYTPSSGSAATYRSVWEEISGTRRITYYYVF